MKILVATSALAIIGNFNGQGIGRVSGSRGGQDRGVRSQGGCVGGSVAYELEIDISYVTRYFEDSEWVEISNETRRRIS